jgi:hypothetical protein
MLIQLRRGTVQFYLKQFSVWDVFNEFKEKYFMIYVVYLYV